ncbi:unnamed protein product [Arabis nemorensis]|uniref:Uncharacterized protein n=1 Tax=Arabis nemorensis TaxID=586526 RepID=A0A565BU59_9BRAS|nr:unnamed protein product [Arabis nemorensis]
MMWGKRSDEDETEENLTVRGGRREGVGRRSVLWWGEHYVVMETTRRMRSGDTAVPKSTTIPQAKAEERLVDHDQDPRIVLVRARFQGAERMHARASGSPVDQGEGLLEVPVTSLGSAGCGMSSTARMWRSTTRTCVEHECGASSDQDELPEVIQARTGSKERRAWQWRAVGVKEGVGSAGTLGGTSVASSTR